MIAWCASCHKSHGDVDRWLRGRRFRCPNDHPGDNFHVAAVIPAESIKWLNFEQALVTWAYNPRLPRQRLFANNAGGYVTAQVILQALALFMVEGRLCTLAVLISFVILLDSIAYNGIVAFITQHAQVPLRSVVFTLVTFFQLAASFAVFFAALPAVNFSGPELNSWSALYFSIVTIATVGYGDIAPAGALSRLLVAIEIAIGVFFLATIVSTIASWANGGTSLPTLEGLLRSDDAR